MDAAFGASKDERRHVYYGDRGPMVVPAHYPPYAYYGGPYYDGRAEYGAVYAYAPAPQRKENLPRLGHWTYEEEVYADTVRELFIKGEIPDCREGVTLRVLMAELLNCTPMRISKKFNRAKALGKVEYRPCAGEIDKAAVRRLRDAERTFHESLGDLYELKCTIFKSADLVLLADYFKPVIVGFAPIDEPHAAPTSGAPAAITYVAPPTVEGPRSPDVGNYGGRKRAFPGALPAQEASRPPSIYAHYPIHDHRQPPPPGHTSVVSPRPPHPFGAASRGPAPTNIPMMVYGSDPYAAQYGRTHDGYGNMPAGGTEAYAPVRAHYYRTQGM